MLWQQRRLAALVVLGRAAVLGSYAYGLLASGAGAGALWGGVPEVLLPAYQVNMVLATTGVFAYTHLLLLRVDPEAVRIGGRAAFGVFYFSDALLWPALFRVGG